MIIININFSLIDTIIVLSFFKDMFDEIVLFGLSKVILRNSLLAMP